MVTKFAVEVCRLSRVKAESRIVVIFWGCELEIACVRMRDGEAPAANVASSSDPRNAVWEQKDRRALICQEQSRVEFVRL